MINRKPSLIWFIDLEEEVPRNLDNIKIYKDKRSFVNKIKFTTSLE